MKKFFIIFALNYVGMVLLLYFLFEVIPDYFPDDPPLTGVDFILRLLGAPTAIIALILTFPSLLLADLLRLTTFFGLLAPYQQALLTLPISASLWAWVIIIMQRRWRNRRIVHCDT